VDLVRQRYCLGVCAWNAEKPPACASLPSCDAFRTSNVPPVGIPPAPSSALDEATGFGLGTQHSTGGTGFTPLPIAVPSWFDPIPGCRIVVPAGRGFFCLCLPAILKHLCLPAGSYPDRGNGRVAKALQKRVGACCVYARKFACNQEEHPLSQRSNRMCLWKLRNDTTY
jgi:hypothetical protein